MLRSSSELLGSAPTSELQAFLSPYKSAVCWRESPLLRSFEVKNSELWLQMGPVSAVCGELCLPSLEREIWPKLHVGGCCVGSLMAMAVDHGAASQLGATDHKWLVHCCSRSNGNLHTRRC